MTTSAQQRFRVWCDMSLPDALRQQLENAIVDAGGSLVFSRQTTTSNLFSAPSENAALDSDVAFGQPNPADVISSKRLKWVHLNTAGYTRYDDEQLREAMRSRGAVMTNSSDVYAEPCAQHLLAFMLAHARRVPQSLQSQQARTWNYDSLRPKVRVLRDESALIVGYGSIGARLAQMLLTIGMNVRAVRRTPRGDEIVPTAAVDQLDALLPTSDHVIDVLPSAPHTARTFDARRFALMRKGAAFYNVGRGDTVDQEALRDALTRGHLGAAYLDVTVPEPLPANDPLWIAPNCFISPHIAGGMQDEQRRLIEHFLANLKRWRGGQVLLNRIA